MPESYESYLRRTFTKDAMLERQSQRLAGNLNRPKRIVGLPGLAQQLTAKWKRERIASQSQSTAISP